MHLINTDGLALVGPGSEWFWTALTGLILAITFFAIYRQLSIARDASAYEQLTQFEHELGSERMLYHELEVLTALRDGVDPVSVPVASAVTIAAFWETVGGLARRGHLDPELLWQGSGFQAARWWVALEPYARARRAAVGPSQYEHFEWLAGVMAGFDQRAGSRPADQALLADQLEWRISLYRDLLQAERALRTDVLASRQAVPTTSSAGPTAVEA